MFALFAMS